jgi:hypothetical protein
LWQKEQRSDSSDPRDVFIEAATPGEAVQAENLLSVYTRLQMDKGTPEGTTVHHKGTSRDYEGCSRIKNA